jgi:hypothetical protein
LDVEHEEMLALTTIVVKQGSRFFCRIRGVDGVPQKVKLRRGLLLLAAGRTEARNGPACVGFIDRLPDESTGIDGIARSLISAFDQADIVAFRGAGLCTKRRNGKRLQYDLVRPKPRRHLTRETPDDA